jgi:uracil-DNA glycosylase family 4
VSGTGEGGGADADAEGGDDLHPDPDDRFVVCAGCARCPELVDSRTRISWGNGPRDADVVVVGEAPGAGDADAERWRGGNHSGLAYTSRHSGRRIRRLLADAGVDEAYYTNAVNCFPGDGDGGNRQPTPAELANCRPLLERELAVVDPAVVVPTGRHATETVFALDGRELDGFLEAVLDPVASAALSATVVPLLHPSYRDVWAARLGYEGEAYREAVADVVNGVL